MIKLQLPQVFQKLRTAYHRHFTFGTSPLPSGRRTTLLEDVRRVGPKKPVGYVTLRVIGSEAELSRLVREAHFKGLKTRMASRFYIRSGALYVYDSVALQGLLDTHQQTLKKARIPIQADRFVVHIIRWTVRDEAACKVVAAAFGNSSF